MNSENRDRILRRCGNATSGDAAVCFASDDTSSPGGQVRQRTLGNSAASTSGRHDGDAVLGPWVHPLLAVGNNARLTPKPQVVRRTKFVQPHRFRHIQHLFRTAADHHFASTSECLRCIVHLLQLDLEQRCPRENRPELHTNFGMHRVLPSAACIGERARTFLCPWPM